MKKLEFFIVPLCAALVVCFGFGQVGIAQQNDEKSAAEKVEKPPGEAAETQAFLGLGVAPLHPAIASQLSDVIGKDRGVMVANVTKDSPADQAGLKLHDVLVTYDKHDVYSPEQLVKMVRNDKAGREVVLGYVHAGQLHEATIKLGEAPKRESVHPGLGLRLPLQRDDLGEFDLKRFGLLPDNRFWQGLPDDPSQWTEFQSMSVTKNEDGNYRAEIKYRHEKENIERVYEGTRDEIKDAIKSDKDLPQQVKNHILRAMDERPNIRDFVPQEFFRGLNRFNRDFFDRDSLERELFNWPEIDF